MAKVTVRNIFETRRNLVRFENYARRHMDNLPISEANDNIAAARKLLAANVDTFDNCDVTELTADNTDALRRIQRMESEVQYYTDQIQELKADRKAEKKDAKRNDYTPDLDWFNNRIAEMKEYRRDYRQELQDAQDEL